MGVVSSSEATICLVDEQRVMESMDRHGVRALSPESLMWSVFRVGIGLKYFSFDGTIGTYIICGHIILYKMWLFKSTDALLDRGTCISFLFLDSPCTRHEAAYDV